MEQRTLQKIARIRTIVAREGMAFDVGRFATDPAYARSTLDGILASSTDETVLLTGLELLSELGFISASPATAKPAPKAEQQVATTHNSPNDRYVGRLR